MFTQMINLLRAICKAKLIGCLQQDFYGKRRSNSQANQIVIEDYLFKISRITGNSEYDIFRKSAEDWPVSGDRIEQDFRRYLFQQDVPYYVTDFVRKNQKHIDELHIPRFL